MQLEGIHHITAITGDAPRNVDFYTRVLGLRMAAKTVNQDDPTVYHLFYADERGRPGSELTFFEYPGAPSGRAGAGMGHRIVWRVGAPEALEFWATRLDGATRGPDGSVLFEDFEGLAHEIVVTTRSHEPPGPPRPQRPPSPLPSRDPRGVRAPGVRGRPRLPRRSRAQRAAARAPAGRPFPR